MGRVEGKVAFITGAARGQGRSHAIRLAQEGADIIAVDIEQQVETSFCPTATAADMAETVKMVEELDRRIIAHTADVRDMTALKSVVDEGVAEFGRLDIVCANAGIASSGVLWEIDENTFQEMIDINLTGVWKTIKATVPTLIEQGTGGSVILTSSVAGVEAYGNLGHYVAAKHGVTGLMRSLALEGAPHGIRCNSVHPTTVDTPMIDNPLGYELFTGGIKGATREDMEAGLLYMNALRVPWVEAIDISNMVLFLASDESRYVTGTTQLVDAGTTIPFKIPPG
ncbi:MAG TPA: mycofactocin-coupled SDR family oxidoreductase [Pseudonocardia sp.]|nr:mycofactocin-coupled SDR family oxidoreductase [Pseudonocardia sp.]